MVKQNDVSDVVGGEHVPRAEPARPKKKLLSPELEAMNRIDRILSSIEDESIRIRVARWAAEKHIPLMRDQQCSSQPPNQ